MREKLRERQRERERERKTYTERQKKKSVFAMIAESITGQDKPTRSLDFFKSVDFLSRSKI